MNHQQEAPDLTVDFLIDYDFQSRKLISEKGEDMTVVIYLPNLLSKQSKQDLQLIHSKIQELPFQIGVKVLVITPDSKYVAFEAASQNMDVVENQRLRIGSDICQKLGRKFGFINSLGISRGMAVIDSDFKTKMVNCCPLGTPLDIKSLTSSLKSVYKMKKIGLAGKNQSITLDLKSHFNISEEENHIRQKFKRSIDLEENESTGICNLARCGGSSSDSDCLLI